MKKFMSVILTLLLAIMVAGSGVLLPMAPASAAGVQVSLNAPAEVLPGSNFTATVNISQVVDLNGAQYDIVFDPAVLVVDNVTAGLIGATAMPVQGFTIVSPGRYRVLQSLMFNTVNGTGYLAVLHFKKSAHEAVLAELGLSGERTTYLEDYGHIGQNDQLLSIDLGLSSGKIKDGDNIVLVGAGLGFVWAASVVRWGPIKEE